MAHAFVNSSHEIASKVEAVRLTFEIKGDETDIFASLARARRSNLNPIHRSFSFSPCVPVERSVEGVYYQSNSRIPAVRLLPQEDAPRSLRSQRQFMRCYACQDDSLPFLSRSLSLSKRWERLGEGVFIGACVFQSKARDCFAHYRGLAKAISGYV